MITNNLDMKKDSVWKIITEHLEMHQIGTVTDRRWKVRNYAQLTVDRVLPFGRTIKQKIK